MAKTHTTTANLTVKIIANDKANPPGKLADAELHFGDGILSGLKLIGFLRIRMHRRGTRLRGELALSRLALSITL